MQSGGGALPHAHPCMGVALHRLQRHRHSGGRRGGHRARAIRNAAARLRQQLLLCHALEGAAFAGTARRSCLAWRAFRMLLSSCPAESTQCVPRLPLCFPVCSGGSPRGSGTTSWRSACCAAAWGALVL